MVSQELILPINTEKKAGMEQYMKNKFPFCGIQSVERRNLATDLLQSSKLLPVSEVLKLIHFYYGKAEREYQYIAVDIAVANVKRFSLIDVEEISQLVVQKSWWDSVDALRKFFGLWVKNNWENFVDVFELFYTSDDFWMRRIAINLQLMYRKETKIDYLEKSILQDRETDEFFIQKAIGWSLREYSKTDAEWVRNFIQQNDLSKLAVREGGKYL